MIKRVEYWDICNNPEKANCTLANEVDRVNNDIYTCLVGNAKFFVIDESTKDSLNSLYRDLTRYKKEGKF